MWLQGQLPFRLPPAVALIRTLLIYPAPVLTPDSAGRHPRNLLFRGALRHPVDRTCLAWRPGTVSGLSLRAVLMVLGTVNSFCAPRNHTCCMQCNPMSLVSGPVAACSACTLIPPPCHLHLSPPSLLLIPASPVLPLLPVPPSLSHSPPSPLVPLTPTTDLLSSLHSPPSQP